MVRKAHRSGRRPPRGVGVLFGDRDLLVVEKPPGLLTITIGTSTERTRTLYSRVTDYVRGGVAWSRERVFIVHRLDREASGILVFARTQQAKADLQAQWPTVEKGYMAVVHGRVSPASAMLTSYLVEAGAYRVHSTRDRSKGKLARMQYRLVREGNGLSLLSIALLTGRKHQIRVQLADRGHAIVGDDRYGRSDTAHRRLALHARSLAFDHPATGLRMTFETKVPKYFTDLVSHRA
jgi:tRNA pseudouridine32 synthase/23S rRNA pseudouridine746 synthase/23S rRNA pseudouridine1911/1915/1917 synthase